MKRIVVLLHLLGGISLIAQHLPDLYYEEPKPSIGYWENKGQVTDPNGGPISRVKFYSEGAQPRSWLLDSSRVAFSMAMVDDISGTLDTFTTSICSLLVKEQGSVCLKAMTLKHITRTSFLITQLPTG
ncbi:MAG: hypothetical protein IPJ87_06705 [Flavobacteriales bacterium]|nr:hypothetical protein [Flavobacteriales bacterium]MBK7941550.1 hypothetical protein [Flavobacteriales bacterium]MBK8949425.1 hypothetical protein [Flavobacteriales bacterium]MBK9700096.1 hypothetical protein [Flavobacteriales bacterium]